MARPKSLPKVRRYSDEFKVKAVQLSLVPGVQVQAVAEALEIHPFMLSRWRKQMRDGDLKAEGARMQVDAGRVREIRRLQQLEREHALLKEEHELLKKAIRFCSERRPRSSPSSTRRGRSTG